MRRCDKALTSLQTEPHTWSLVGGMEMIRARVARHTSGHRSTTVRAGVGSGQQRTERPRRHSAPQRIGNDLVRDSVFASKCFGSRLGLVHACRHEHKHKISPQKANGAVSNAPARPVKQIFSRLALETFGVRNITKHALNRKH